MNISLKDTLVGIDREHIWSMILFRNLNDWEIEEYMNLLNSPTQVSMEG